MENIGVDAAKLAGLQIDTLQKLRAGQITIGQWERFNNLSPEDREACFGTAKKPPTPQPVPVEKFTLLADLGIITVPEDYDRTKSLAKFAEKYRDEFLHYNKDITDANFANPSRILKAGDQLWTYAFKQAVSGRTTSTERLDFIRSRQGILTGAQGASLVFEQKRNQLPKGYWYYSFDQKDALWKDAAGGHRVPCVGRHSGDVFEFDLGYFEGGWGDVDCFLVFCDKPLGA